VRKNVNNTRTFSFIQTRIKEYFTSRKIFSYNALRHPRVPTQPLRATANNQTYSRPTMTSSISGPLPITEESSLTPVSSSQSIASSNDSSSNENVLKPTRGRITRTLSGLRGKAGTASPNSIQQPRRFSSAVVTDKDSSHDYAKGRTTIVVPAIETTLTDLSASVTSTHSDHGLMSGARPVLLKPKSIRRYSSAPIEESARKVLTIPPPLRLEAWTEPPADSFKVRGQYYLRNGKKVPSDGSVFSLLSVDVVRSDELIMEGLCSLPNERIQLALKREQETGIRELPAYVFVVNIAVPGPPCYHLVSYFGLEDMETITTDKTPFGRVARRFFFGKSDEFRDETFKLIPRITEGNFVVKKAVGSKPTLLGTKLTQKYVRSERYFELIVDISSDEVAKRIVKLSIGYVS
jgi:hypothetical protein